MSYNPKLDIYEGYIYLVTNKINNKKYVGQTITTIQKRWKQHCSAVIRKGTTLFDKKIKQYGKENFYIEEIIKVSDPDLDQLKERLDISERQYIQKYNSYTEKLGGFGYNVDFGGQSNNIFSKPIDVYNMEGELVATYPSKTTTALKYGINEKQIWDICNGKQENYRCLCVFRFKGEPFDKYNVVSKIYKEIYQFSLNGELVGKYNSYNQIYKKYHLSFIGDIIDNPYRIAGGYWWSSSLEFNYLGEEKKPTKIVNMYDLWGNLIKSYSSLSECSKDTGYTYMVISNNCKGKTSNVDNYLFRYKDDSYDKYDYKFKEKLSKAIIRYNYEINQYYINGELVNQYFCIDDISNISYSNVIDCCLHKRDTVKKYIWRFSFDYYNPNTLLDERRKRHKNYIFRPIDVYNLQSNFIITLRSVKACEDFFGKCNLRLLAKVLAEKRTMYGYIIRKHGEKLEQYNDWRIPIDKYSLDGRLLGEYTSISEGLKSIGINKKGIRSIEQCLNNEVTQSYGYVWRRHGVPFSEGKFTKNYSHTSVNCYSLDNIFIQRFEYINDAAKFINRSNSSITQCCKKRSKTSGGYKWFYTNDLEQPDKTKIE